MPRAASEVVVPVVIPLVAAIVAVAVVVDALAAVTLRPRVGDDGLGLPLARVELLL